MLSDLGRETASKRCVLAQYKRESQRYGVIRWRELKDDVAHQQYVNRSREASLTDRFGMTSSWILCKQHVNVNN